ncbi:MAG: hypothetical protein KGM15_00480 [Pseudomonadota bacterium]|nr:hypothetical protein [Pseudomonadota bacterium]
MAAAGKSRAKAEVGRAVSAELIAVLAAVTDGQPRVLTIHDGASLPSGPFEVGHRSLQHGLRDWVAQQTRHSLGYVEQLYTFADRDRKPGGSDQRAISISYLALTREQRAAAPEVEWRDWYDYFPWEDHRAGPPPVIAQTLAPRLRAWAEAAADGEARQSRWRRAAIAFGLEGRAWNDEWALQRYELLYEAGLVAESGGDGAGRAMTGDHRRILATGIARLRAKIKYHPVVFELLPDSFTLLQLQKCVEALAGRRVHKPNFRRLIEQQELVEETGAAVSDTGGRPAKLFRFRHEVLEERALAGTKLPLARA